MPFSSYFEENVELRAELAAARERLATAEADSRRMREALSKISDGAEVDISSLVGNEGVVLCCYCGNVPHGEECPATIARSAIDAATEGN